MPAAGSAIATILLVEDDEPLRFVLSIALRRRGYSVLCASSAEEAVSLSERHAAPIDVLLTDVVMPGMSGPDLARRLGAKRANMKILCMSGYTEDVLIRYGVLPGDASFIHKPITPSMLATRIREVLGAAQPLGSPVKAREPSVAAA